MSEELNHELIDALYRSRLTLLDHLDDFGYDTQQYRKFSPKEIHEMVKATTKVAVIAPAFQMEFEKKEGVVTPAGQPTKCFVIYSIHSIKPKQKIMNFTNKIIEVFPDIDKKTTEIIVITLDPIAATFHSTARYFWQSEGINVRYFQAQSIINNPLKHVLVPKHEKVPKDQEEALLKEFNAKKSQLPLILYHEDPIARMIGLLPGDIVKITRPSPTAGECVLYRVCV